MTQVRRSELPAHLTRRAHLHLSTHASQLDEYRTAERERERKRDRSARVRPEDDGAQAALRKKAKRKEQREAEDQACRASRVSLDVQRDGYVRLLVWRSADRYWLQEKRQRAPVSRMRLYMFVCSAAELACVRAGVACPDGERRLACARSLLCR